MNNFINHLCFSFHKIMNHYRLTQKSRKVCTLLKRYKATELTFFWVKISPFVPLRSHSRSYFNPAQASIRFLKLAIWLALVAAVLFHHIKRATMSKKLKNEEEIFLVLWQLLTAQIHMNSTNLVMEYKDITVKSKHASNKGENHTRVD